ncbi:MAG TPA: signal peptidase II [Thermomicrobiales bacterium]|nr:signal peptidase II [Thermomicrobiales bacterium]
MCAEHLAQIVTEECHINGKPTQSAAARFSLLIGAVAFTTTLLLDQLSKRIVLETIGPDGSRDAVEIIPGVLQFRFVRNTGSAFGMFQGNSDILKVLAIVAVVGLFVYYARTASRDWIISLALGLQLGGALGNIVDRFRHGYVVDFIDFPRFPTFNVADSAITVGVILLMYAMLFRDSQLHDTPDRQRPSEQPHIAGDDA